MHSGIRWQRDLKRSRKIALKKSDFKKLSQKKYYITKIIAGMSMTFRMILDMENMFTLSYKYYFSFKI